MPSVVADAPTISGDDASSSARATTYNVPQQRIVSIEHPCIVKNFNNGFRSLGREQQIKHVRLFSQLLPLDCGLTCCQVLEHEVGDPDNHGPKKKKNIEPEPVLGVSLRPDDPFAKKISSTGIQTQDVLLKVTLPKRTGRKRKRGSDEPFVSSPQPKKRDYSMTAPELLQRLRDNPDTYTLEAVGMIKDTHRFRHLPDFQVRAAELPIMREMRDHAMEPEYDALKSFHVDLKPGCAGITAFPGPPSFVPPGQPYRYEYQEFLGVRSDRRLKSQAQTSPTDKAPRSAPIMVDLCNSTIIPEKPPPDLSSSSSTTTGTDVPSAIVALKQVLEDRPIISKRAATSITKGQHGLSTIMRTVPHLGYLINGGPWRDAIVKYGVDPRKDPKYRVYQTLALQIEGNEAIEATQDRRKESKQSHVFEGNTAAHPEKRWQLCDLTDPVLRDLVYRDNYRTECDLELWGWYHNGTLAKIRVILKDKLMRLVNKEALLSDEEYGVIASLPDEIEQASDCRIDPLLHGDEVKALCDAVGQEAMRTHPDTNEAKGNRVSFDATADDELEVDESGAVGEEGIDDDGEHAADVLFEARDEERDDGMGDGHEDC